jgi:hypothetical protein
MIYHIRTRTDSNETSLSEFSCPFQATRHKCLFKIRCPFPSPSLNFSKKKTLLQNILLTFFTFYITSTLFYYFLNKKFTTIQIFFTFPYKLFQLYITSILIFNHSKEKTQGKGRVMGFSNGATIIC